MFLTATNLAYYLLSRGHISPEDIVHGDCMVIESGRRNRNFKVIRRNTPGLFVKQLPIVAEETVNSVFREAVCYQLAQENPAFSSLGSVTPRLLDYDPRRHSLIIEFLEHSENLNEFHLRLGDYPESIGRMIGRAMAGYHKDAPRMLSNPEPLAVFPRTPPWVLSIAQDQEMLMPNASAAIKEVVRILRHTPGLLQGLAACKEDWQPHCLIHGDIKWDNFLLISSAEGEHTLRIIDWELADIGDAAWDVACVFTAYVQYWLLMVPMDASASDPTLLLSRAPRPLGSVWPALRGFWQEYVNTSGIPAELAASQLRRCVQYTGARLVLTAIEVNNGREQLAPVTGMMLQLAHSILQEPVRAASELLGLTSPYPVLPSPVGMPPATAPVTT